MSRVERGFKSRRLRNPSPRPRSLRRPPLERGLPPRTRTITIFGAPVGPAVRLYTDAMYEEGQPSGIGIVAFFPARDSRPAYVRHAHGSIPERTLRRIFDPHKRQYIGQTEILAALAAYFTLAADIRGVQVIHISSIIPARRPRSSTATPERPTP
eukprot:scaffold22672_cov108-Isochrysis_galbana.AAC.3